MYKGILKPLGDRLVAFLVLIIVMPFLIIFCILLLIANKGTPFFLQRRPGLHGKVFKVIKFKTMNDAVDENGKLLPDFQRITKIGKFVRSTSIDELPQLFNVLIGEMSFVGPRPLLERYLPLYNQQQRRRHEVLPGITGWAQVNGRNAISWEQKFDLDIYYVNNISFALDTKILLLTIMKVVKREGVQNNEAQPMPEFKGSNK